MPKYLVGRREVHVSLVEVHAADPEEAKYKVAKMTDDIVETDYLEYSHTLDPETWSVELAEEAPCNT